MNLISELAGLIYGVLDISQGLSDPRARTRLDGFVDALVEAGADRGIHRSGPDAVACGAAVLVFRDAGKELDEAALEDIERVRPCMKS
ncbi:MAG TPA: hypothetical protein VFZ75_12410 [Actinomycetota bacterium]|nr:hypothetical protein [Actinomycetota bacterium]